MTTEYRTGTGAVITALDDGRIQVEHGDAATHVIGTPLARICQYIEQQERGTLTLSYANGTWIATFNTDRTYSRTAQLADTPGEALAAVSDSIPAMQEVTPPP